MTELKTINDIRKEFSESYGVEIPDQAEVYPRIKAEAIKWVKEMDINRSADYCDGMMDFIMKFFNITGEDLK